MPRLLALLALVLWAAPAAAQDLAQLVEGHWVLLKGELDAQGTFLASSVEVQEPGDSEELTGTVSSVDPRAQSFVLLARPISVSDRTRWDGLRLDQIAGQRVRVQGHWRGGGKFSARQVTPRGAGRDRILGRLGPLSHAAEGVLCARVAGIEVRIPASAKLENETPLAAFALAPLRVSETPNAPQATTDDEDAVPGTWTLARGLTFGLLAEYKGRLERNFDLDDADEKDRLDQRFSLRPQLHWRPAEGFEALLSPRYEIDLREQQGGPDSRDAGLHWSEAWVGVHGLLAGTSLYAGRQLFDDEREWITKANLDALRLVWAGGGARLELSLSTRLDDASERDLHSWNAMAYLSSTDPDRHVAAWIVDRRDNREPRDYPFLFGLRALGEFLPDTDAWFELSGLRGYSGGVNLDGWGYDAGLTWKPEPIAPWYLSAGLAFASGDDPSTPGVVEAYQQTGLQKNNGKLGGVTNFRYYGELFDPELSNLAITTLGLGVRPTRKTSLDLVFHEYRQVRASPSIRSSNLRADPDGVHEGLGRELDLVAGVRTDPRWDLELVLARFEPGAAFPGLDPAWTAGLHLRWRF